MPNKPEHRIQRMGWLRAAVLGANDGILSTASLVLGVATAHAPRSNVLVAGLAGLVAGAMSMAAGEYVSVQSQADTVQAELDVERRELAQDSRGEHKELAGIYVKRGLDSQLAKEVARQLMAHDALASHARDELGLTPAVHVHPAHAAIASAGSFTVGAGMPLLVAWLTPDKSLIPFVALSSLVFLAILGGLAAHAGGGARSVGAMRVTICGAIAMGVTAGVGALFGVAG